MVLNAGNAAEFVETAIQPAIRRGEFDNLPGAGKPIEVLEDFNRRVVEARRQLLGGPPVVAGAVTLESPNTLDIAAVAAQLRTVGAVMQSDANAFAESIIHDGWYTYTIDVVFDQRVYTERFAAEETK